MVDKRKTIDLLPGYLQTETLSKVFSTTVDNLFQPSSIDLLNGYIGKKPEWYDKTKDFYISEPTKARQDYQFSPTPTSKNYLNGQITNALFYEDLLGGLRFQGANVDNPDRLFNQEYYSWSPPIDHDKLVNFVNYFWLPFGPAGIRLLNRTNLGTDVESKSTYTYKGAYQYTSTEEIVYGELTFTSGLKIIPTQDIDQNYNNNEFYVEGVGKKIVLISAASNQLPGWDVKPWDTTGWDGVQETEKEYVTISRASNDGNNWSQTNGWFHTDILTISKTTLPDASLSQARRPIIEFNADLELYQYGTQNRGTVDVVDDFTTDFLGTVVGQPSWEIANDPLDPLSPKVPLLDGMRVLITADENILVNNKIYQVSGQLLGAIQLTPVPNDGNTSGTALVGDRTTIRFGKYQGKNLYFNGSVWNDNGQQKYKTRGDFTVSWPFFNLYDVDGNALDDPSIYPNSSFHGSPIFSYTIDSNSPIDSILGLPIKLDQFGDYVFDNVIETETVRYNLDLDTVQYYGNKFARIVDTSVDQYVNGWYKSSTPSRQYILNEFAVLTDTYEFKIDQSPAYAIDNTLPTIFVDKITSDKTSTRLLLGNDYTVVDNLVFLNQPAVAGDRVLIRSWNPDKPSKITGFYELPKNLTANPNNLPITSVTRGQFLQQFIDLIQNQTGFSGQALGKNNYRDTAQEKSLGFTILQHRAPLIKLSLLMSTAFSNIGGNISPTDVMLAIQFAQRSYQRFYNRLLKTLFSITQTNGAFTANATSGCDPYNIRELITRALKQINIGKTKSSPWANSGPDGLTGGYCSTESTNPTFVPATATRLGLTPAYQPTVYKDTSYTVTQLVIETHDGSRIIMVDDDGLPLGDILHGQQYTVNPEELTNPVAAAWLQFELDLFNNLPSIYKDTEASLVFDIRNFVPGKWRQTEYSREEVIGIQRPIFDKWVLNSQIDYRANNTFDATNAFTYNYKSVRDRDGEEVPGYWKGIYRYFYDTDRPHTHPWEMLGFSQKPTWWDTQYGPSPYTNGNTALWSDLRDGIIRQGPRQGTHTSWSRPGLLGCIPVDDQGELLPPYLAGCVASIPSVYESSSSWEFGDGAPVESTWITSQDYNFVLAQTGYLLKPAQFIEYTWDTPRTFNAFSNYQGAQWLYKDTNSRRSSQQFYVHREIPISLSTGENIPNETDLTYFGSCGVQHWISEYLISQSLNVTSYFGNLIRGGNVQLAHRMAGYINSDSIRTVVDSFGNVGYATRLVPNENVYNHLYRSTSIGENFYSGMIVEQVRNGWRIYGYDAINTNFTVLLPDTKSTKTTVVIANQKVVEYSTYTSQEEIIPYGTIITSRQQVYDAIIGYGKWLEKQGWIFEEFSSDSNAILDWTNSAKEFLFWSQGAWSPGTFISLSPSAEKVKFKNNFGNIQYVNGIIAGTYPVLDKSGRPIQPQFINVLRDENSITVATTNEQGIYAIRLYRNTLEHALFFDNTTSFNDIMYDPLFGLQQERIKLYAYRTNDWNGTLNAPGSILIENTVSNTWTTTSNFEKTTSDIRKYFEINEPSSYTEISANGQFITKQSAVSAVDVQDIHSLAKHTIAWQERAYLQNQLLQDTTEFEFYQGFIKQKGTKSSLNKLLRNISILPIGSSLEYYEEWLLRLSNYGATSLNDVIEFKLDQGKMITNPQWIRLFSNNYSDKERDPVIDIVQNDPAIVVPPENYTEKLFTLRQSYQPNTASDLPTAGYAMLGETTWMVKNTDELLNLYDQQKDTNRPLKERDTVWQFINDKKEWTAWILVKALGQVQETIPSYITGEPTVISTDQPHGLLNGDICVIYDVIGVSPINGTYKIFNVLPSSFQIIPSTYEVGGAGKLYVYRPVKFATLFDRDSGEPPGGWQDGELAYVDEGGKEPGAWSVYKRENDSWVLYRQQEYQVDTDLLYDSEFYDSKTKRLLTSANYFDPAKGRILGKADAEITYKIDYDPAKYTSGNSTGYAIDATQAWGSAQLGEVWWDLSTVRYIDYEQGDETYRSKNWGKLAPGTSIDIYEWIRSSVPPSDWASYVAQGRSVTDNGRTYIPSGEIRNANNPNWSEVVEYGTDGREKVYYYFWVKNSSMGPSATWRTLTTQNISSLISDPNNDDRPWYAAISQKSLLVGNYSSYLNADRTIMRLNYSKDLNDDNVYNEWELVREGDRYSPINTLLWNKMKDSLTSQVLREGNNQQLDVGYDVPDYKLNSLIRYGTALRPRQTWFVDRVAASKLFVDSFNQLLANSVTPLTDDSAKSRWIQYFNRAEPIPSQTGNWDYRCVDITQRDNLVGYIEPGQKVLVDPVAATNNLWTIWKYTGGTAWILIREQAYNTTKYWSYVDWYAAGYGTATQIATTVATVLDLDQITPYTGMIVKVQDNGSNKWQLYSYNSKWNLVGQQDGNVEISSNVYNWAKWLGGFDSHGFDTTAYDTTAAIEFANIIDGIKYAIFAEPNSLELNTLFFAMINYVVAEQGSVDWIAKTSNIILRGINTPLSLVKSTILAEDYTDSILDYMNEAKPYHAKIREFIPGKTGFTAAGFAAVDFDVPPGYQTAIMTNVDDGNGHSIEPYYAQGPLTYLKEYEESSSTFVTDTEQQLDLAFDNTFASWFNNYKLHPELVRNLKVQLIFDRVATSKTPHGWSWIWDQGGWDSYVDMGAYQRIQDFYTPTVGMPPKDIDSLISGAEYRGTILDGYDFDVAAGWDLSPWDAPIGWSPDPASIDFEQYLDQIIQGGYAPQYDTAIGTGSKIDFTVRGDAVNPNDIVVWADRKVKIYGTDYIFPTFAKSVYIAEGGSGYLVGDILEVIAGDAIAPVRVQVTEVNGSSISKLIILGTGMYNTVQHGPYLSQYQYGATVNGSGAIIGVDWDCTTLRFAAPPSSSAISNIYVLYLGTTFASAPIYDSDTLYEGNEFIQPHIDDQHPEELYPLAVRDAIMIDTHTRQAGGRALVMKKIYQTDGIQDQFYLGITPQDDQAVIAYLNGTLLTPGIGNDFVINYNSNFIVFLTPPTIGILDITVIGVGGAGRSISEAYVSDRGIGYSPGDLISLQAGGGIPALLKLNSVVAVGTTLVSSGNGYVRGDTLTLANVGSNDIPVVLRVDDADIGTGAILSLSILDHGTIHTIPPVLTWISSKDARNSAPPAVITIDWGADNASIIQAGLYRRMPLQPIPQLSVAPIGGTGATWEILFTKSILNQYTFTGTGGNPTDLTIPNIGNGTPILVNVNGTLEGFTYLTNGIRLNNPAPYGAIIKVTVFDNANFSTIVETVINVTNPLILTYNLNLPEPGITQPVYLGSIVRVNGDLLEPPLIQQFRGNAATKIFVLSVDPTGSTPRVWIDQVENAIPWTIVGNILSFAYAPPDDADIVLLCVKPSTKYTIFGNQITFGSGVLNNGDIVSILGFNQDVDYEFHNEQYTGREDGKYLLTKRPNELSTVMVWLNGELQVLMYDYTIEFNTLKGGYDVDPYDIYGWDDPLKDGAVVRFSPTKARNPSDAIVVSYMTGQPWRPSISWRTLQNNSASKSIVLDPDRQTILLSNVYTTSSSIEIQDVTKISSPIDGEFGAIYINNELIEFEQITLAPTPSIPNRAFLTKLRRNRNGTSGNPLALYNAIFYNGNGVETHFQLESATQALSTTVWLDGKLLRQGNDPTLPDPMDPTQNGIPLDFYIKLNPIGYPAGAYAVLTDAPASGYKNVKIVALNQDSIDNNLCHVALSNVIDAGRIVQLPMGYSWEPAAKGLQYNKTAMAKFLLDHSENGS